MQQLVFLILYHYINIIMSEVDCIVYLKENFCVRKFY